MSVERRGPLCNPSYNAIYTGHGPLREPSVLEDLHNLYIACYPPTFPIVITINSHTWIWMYLLRLLFSSSQLARWDAPQIRSSLNHVTPTLTGSANVSTNFTYIFYIGLFHRSNAFQFWPIGGNHRKNELAIISGFPGSILVILCRYCFYGTAFFFSK